MNSQEEQLTRDFAQFIEDVEGLLQNARQLSGDGADVARSRIEDQLQLAKSRLRLALEAADDGMEQSLSIAQGYVRERPVTAVCVAAAVGLALGLLMTRR